VLKLKCWKCLISVELRIESSDSVRSKQSTIKNERRKNLISPLKPLFQELRIQVLLGIMPKTTMSPPNRQYLQ